jgi:hypothetical protein
LTKTIFVEKVEKWFTRRKLEVYDLLHTVVKNQKHHNSYSFMLTTFSCRHFLQLFKRISNQHQICLFYTPLEFSCKFFLKVITAHFSNVEANCARNGPKNKKKFFHKREPACSMYIYQFRVQTTNPSTHHTATNTDRSETSDANLDIRP